MFQNLQTSLLYDFNTIVLNLPSSFKPRNVKMFEPHMVLKEKSQNQRRQKFFVIVEANLNNVSDHLSNNCDPAISFYHSVSMIFPPLLFMSPVRVHRFWCCLCPCQSSVRPWRWLMPSDATIRENLVLHPSGDEKGFVTPLAEKSMSRRLFVQTHNLTPCLLFKVRMILKVLPTHFVCYKMHNLVALQQDNQAHLLLCVLFWASSSVSF